MRNDRNLDIVSINTYTKFGQILSIFTQDIERKQNYDRITDGQNNRQPKSSIA